MSGILTVTICLLILVNLLSFALFGIDKRRAERDRWRVPERSLWLMCAPFAALGGLIGMYVFHHKTHKPAFRLGMPALLAAQAAIAVAAMCF